MRLTVALAGAALLLGAAPANAQDGQDGGLVVCNARGECERVEDVCEVASSERDREIERGPADRFGGDELGRKFPLVLSQDRLQQDFRIDEEDEEAEACMALFGPGQQAAVSPGAAAPAPLPGPPLPLIAGPPVLLGAIVGAAALGIGGGNENAAGTSTTATTTTPATTGGAQ